METTLATTARRTERTFEDAWALFTREVMKHQSVTCALSETFACFGSDLTHEVEQAWDAMVALVGMAEE